MQLFCKKGIHISRFISVCLFIALSKAKFAKNFHILLCSSLLDMNKKPVIFKLLCVLFCFLVETDTGKASTVAVIFVFNLFRSHILFQI